MAKFAQTYSKSCGAAALMCAAIELDVKTIPSNPIHSLWANEHKIRLPNGDMKSEKMIYAITSGDSGIPNERSGYSLPSKIAIASRLLGLTTISFVPKSTIGNLLLFLYGSEKLNAKNAGMLVKRESIPVLQNGQRLLKILRGGDVSCWKPAFGLHYVMQRPDLSIMDPCEGKNYRNLNECIKNYSSDDIYLKDTGLGILVV